MKRRLQEASEVHQPIGPGAYQCRMLTSRAYTSAEGNPNAVVPNWICVCTNSLVICMLPVQSQLPLLACLQLPLNETLDHSGRGEWIVLENNLVVRNKGVGLDKNLSRLWENSSVKMNRAPRETPTSFFFRTRSLISPSQPGNGFVSSV